ncbi:MAG: C4-dicarboxylate ABC transporter substrate-binding protein [Polaromonas sp.]|uniref:TRAP transporter small permease subunit n=1 Tax=Polaromonas sp. TaxID=1869339 RepID=UPI0040364534|nr:C4-dicarboxylate ABC transporter substrate-binding protein [Polaromonas sp.]
MHALLKFSNFVDWLNSLVGRWSIWLILASTVISGVNAVVRKAFNIGSNAYLEVQWYLFAASFLLAAGYTLLQNEHVRIDVIASRFTRRTQVKMELFGFAFMLAPMCLAIMYFAWPFFMNGYTSGEMSNNSGGLIRWPVYLLMPVGFALLLLQGISEFIKRVAFLKGMVDDPAVKSEGKSAEEELAEAIRRLAETKTAAADVK